MSNLLKDASILLTPTGYDNGRMNAIKPYKDLYGPELVTNGDFSQGTQDWTFNTSGNNQWSVVNEKAVYNASSTDFIITNNVLTIGKKYLVSFDISDTNNSTIRLSVNSEAGGSFDDYTNGDGRYTKYITANTNYLRIGGSASGASFSIDNVSVVEDLSGDFTFSRNSAATRVNEQGLVENVQIISPELVSNGDFSQEGSELVTNGDFATDSDWSLSSGSSIANGKLTIDALDGSYQYAKQIVNTTIGSTYKLEFDITEINDVGKVQLLYNNAIIGETEYNSIGTYTLYFESTNSSGLLEIKRKHPSDTNASIDNVSVKEVGQDWTLGTGWSIGDGKATADGTINSNCYQDAVTTIGQTYKYSFDVLDSGSGVIDGRFRNGGGVIQGFSSEGTYTGTFVAYNTLADFTTLSGNTASFSITNISVKEITDDTDLPRIDYSGFSYQDSLGSELVTNGSFDTDTSWNKQSGWVITNGYAESTALNTRSIYQNIGNAVVGKTYKITYTILETNGGNFKVVYGGVNGTIRNTTGTYIEYLKATSSADGTIYFDALNVFIGKIDNISVKEYLGQEVVPDSGCGNWLLEPQSTNLVTYSEDFSQWNANNATIESGYLAPDGTNNAYKVSGDSTSSLTFSLGLNSTDTRTIWARTISGSGQVNLTSHNNNTNNLFTITEQWQRFEVNGTTSSSGQAFFYAVDFRGSSTLTEVVLWGAQAENLSYATSYIPTNGATSTRLQDIANNSGNSTLINSTEGVLYAEIAALANDGTSRQISISDSSYTNTVLLRYLDLSNTLQGVFRVGGAFKGSCNFTLSNPIDSIKVAYKYKNSDFALWVNGAEVSTSTDSFSISANTLNELSFDRGDGTQYFYGKNKALAVYKKALTDANLRCLTYPNPVATTFDLDFDTIAEQFTFTRGSEATFVNEQGLIESTNTLTSNLVIDEESLPLTGWSRDGDVYTAVNASSNFVLNYTSGFNFSIGDLVEVSYEVFDYVSGQPRVQLSGGGQAKYTTPASSNGVFTETLVLTGNNTAGAIIHNNTSPTLKIRNFSIKKVITATNTPRIDYSTGEKAFLLEPQSTNLIAYSEDIASNSFSKIGTSIQADATTSPDGTANADLEKEDASNGSHFIYKDLNLSSGQTYAISVFAKKNGTNRNLRFGDGGVGWSSGFNANFDLTNGTSSGGVIEDYGNGWYRCSVVGTTSATTSRLIVYITLNTSTSYQGDGSSGVFLFGFQVENQSYATSYIPTSGAAATRNQELCVDATPVINSEEGTLYAEISALANDGTIRRLCLSDGTSSQKVLITFSSTTNRIQFEVINSTNQFYKEYVSSDLLDFHKVAIKYKQNDFSVYVNGSKIHSSTSGNTPVGLSELSFDNGTGSQNFFGNTKGLKYYPKALADVQLEDLTTI